MKLSDYGEFALIEKIIEPGFTDLIQEHATGIGDDCAIMPVDDTFSKIFTTDMLVENVHFLRNKITPWQLGFKSLSVNLSDIAAMGGTPSGTFLSLAVPGDTDIEWIKSFMDGYKELSAKENVPLLGGDTTKSEGTIIVNVAVTGTIKNDNIKLRKSARKGDFICTTGSVGDSAGGLQVLLDDLPDDSLNRQLLDQHLTPYPHVQQGKFLSDSPAVHAMIDISDGINSDLNHILKASQLSAFIELSSVPVSKQLREASQKYGWELFELALAGGEDYTLLFTVDPEYYDELNGRFTKTFNQSLQKIGEIGEGSPGITFYKNGKQVESLKGGYTHF